MKKNLARMAAAGTALALSVPAFAQTAPAGLDYSGITDAIDLDTTVTAIVAVGGILILVKVATMGVRKVLSMVR